MNAQPIKFTYQDRDYTLEFTRSSIQQLERSGFNINEIDAKLMTMLPRLFAGAFLANHRFVKQQLIDEMFEKFTNKTALFERLTELYQLPFNAMLDDEVDEKNAIMWE